MSIKSFIKKLSSYDGNSYLKFALQQKKYTIPEAIAEIKKQIESLNRVIIQCQKELGERGSGWFGNSVAKQGLQILNKGLEPFNQATTKFNAINPASIANKDYLTPEAYKLLQVVGALGQLRSGLEKDQDTDRIFYGLQQTAGAVYQNILLILKNIEDSQQTVAPVSAAAPAAGGATANQVSSAPAATPKTTPVPKTPSTQATIPQVDVSGLTEAERYWKSQLDKATTKEQVQNLLEQRNKYIDNLSVSKKTEYKGYAERQKGDKTGLITSDQRPFYKQRATQIAAPYFAKFNK